MKKKQDEKLSQKRLQAIGGASSVLDWTIAVRLAKWGEPMRPHSSVNESVIWLK